MLDLAAVFATAYERGRYAALLDYRSALDREEARRPRLGRADGEGRPPIVHPPLDMPARRLLR